MFVLILKIKYKLLFKKLACKVWICVPQMVPCGTLVPMVCYEIQQVCHEETNTGILKVNIKTATARAHD